MSVIQKTVEVVAQTPTAKARAEKMPHYRRVSQVKQTLLAVGLWLPMTAFVYLLAVPAVWHLVVFLFCLRIANRDLLVDCLKIAKEAVGVVLGAKGGVP